MPRYVVWLWLRPPAHGDRWNPGDALARQDDAGLSVSPSPRPFVSKGVATLSGFFREPGALSANRESRGVISSFFAYLGAYSVLQRWGLEPLIPCCQ